MRFFGFAIACAVPLCGLATVEFSTPFGDGMVLQRGMDVPVWGRASPGEKVEVRFGDATASATAGADGYWRISLPKMEASKKGRELSVRSVPAGEGQVLHDVLVGEVWFVSGQSNCAFPLAGKRPHGCDRMGPLVAAMTRKPFIRYVCASTPEFSVTPRREMNARAEWKTFTPENLGVSPSFSAIGVYFALDVFSAIDVPIGLVGAYRGSTNIEAWIPHERFASVPGLEWCRDWKYVEKRSKWKKSMVHGACRNALRQPSVLWNEMVAPWCPMAMRGFVWYQGCSNSSRDGSGMSEEYRVQMHALYDGWAESFANPNLKLYFVQLAPFTNWWDIQLAQARFAAEEKNAAMVTSCDVGNVHDIHPNEKGTIGRRLAALAMRYDYGFDDLVADAPSIRSCKADGEKVTMEFDNADGWRLYNADWSVDVAFELAGEDGQWHHANLLNKNGGHTKTVPWKTGGDIEGEQLTISASGVDRPVKVRYLYEKPWAGYLYSSHGIPLGPFEADVARP